MFQEMLYALIGSWGRAVIQWALANPVTVGLACGAWLAMIGASKLQLKWLKDRTAELALNSARAVLEKEPQIQVTKLYDRLSPVWTDMVRKTAFFIPHRWEIWPVPATPKRVAERLDFSPEWLGEYLWENGIEVRGATRKKSRKDEQKGL
ncbi:MAG: hypothetical protein P8X64_10770 [Anaerolineales bacterium]|jgi:hypothetical protein